MTEPRHRAAIFDLDGVLVDSSVAHLESWRQLAREIGVGFEDQVFRETFGLRNDSILRRLVGPGLAPDAMRRLGERKEEIFRTIARGRVQPLRGAQACVKGLRAAGWRTGLASSAPRANITMILEELGLTDHLDAVVSGDDVVRGKPDPEIFLQAAARLETSPDQCVVIEDAEAGVVAARRAGMTVVAVSRGAPTPGLMAADLVVADLLAVYPQDMARLLAPRQPARSSQDPSTGA